MTVDLELFEKWMHILLERFDRHEKMIAALTGKEMKEVNYLDGERLLDNQDVCQMLQTSKRSLQRYRSEGYLRYQMLRHKIYYKESDVHKFLKIHFEELGGNKVKKIKQAKKKKPKSAKPTPQAATTEVTLCENLFDL